MATAASAVAPELVTLCGGLTVPRPALELAWALEDRGIGLSADGDRLIVEARSAGDIRERDREQIRRWKSHLVAIVVYVDRDGRLQ